MLNISSSTYTQPQTQSSSPAAELAKGATRSGSESGKVAENRVGARDQLNVQILQASAEVSLKAGNQSQTLLFRSAIERINELSGIDLWFLGKLKNIVEM